MPRTRKPRVTAQRSLAKATICALQVSRAFQICHAATMTSLGRAPDDVP
jgi:hypothetical protein